MITIKSIVDSMEEKCFDILVRKMIDDKLSQDQMFIAMEYLKSDKGRLSMLPMVKKQYLDGSYELKPSDDEPALIIAEIDHRMEKLERKQTN